MLSNGSRSASRFSNAAIHLLREKKKTDRSRPVDRSIFRFLDTVGINVVIIRAASSVGVVAHAGVLKLGQKHKLESKRISSTSKIRVLTIN